MKKKMIAIALVLASGVALAVAWPVNAAYDSSAEASNVRNIQNMGYHAIMRAGKVYKFKFSDGTTAYFMKNPGLTNYRFTQVSEAEYAENPGAEYDPNAEQTQSGGGGGGDLGGSYDDPFAPDNSSLTFPPGAVIVIGGGRVGRVTCEPACTGGL